MKKNLKYILIILLIIILLFVWNFVKKDNNVLINNQNSNLITDENEIKKPTVSQIEDNGVFVFNGLVKNLKIPKQIKIVINEKDQIKEDIINNIINSFGFNEKTKKSYVDSMVYKTDDSKEEIVFNKKTNTVEYSRNLINFPLEIKKMEINEDNFKNKTKQIIKDNFGLEQADLFFNKIVYEKISESNFVLSDKENADIIKLEVNFLINGYPIYGLESSPLVVRFTIDGVLVKINLDWPEKTQETEIYRQIKSLDEISKIPKENFKIISANGGDESTDITLETLEKNFSVISGKFGFLNLPELNSLEPNLILEGKSIIDSKTIYITLAVPISE